jgi:hypothetical protein
MRKRITIVGTLMGAVFALSGFGASAASASGCYLVSNFENLKKGGSFSTINNGTGQCETEVVKLTGRWVLVEALLSKTVEDLYCAKLLLTAGREPEKETGYYKNQNPEKCETVLPKAEENKSDYTEVIVPEMTKLLPEPTAGASLTDRIEQASPGHLLSVGKSEVTCKKGSGTESFTSANEGTGSMTLEECTSSLSTKCTSTGETAGKVKTEGEIHFWLALLMEAGGGSTLVGASVFLFKEIPIVCENATKTIKIEIVVQNKSCLAADVLPTSMNKLVSSVQEEFTEWSSGETQILSALPPETTKEISCLPTIKTNGGTAELFALSALILLSKFEKSGGSLTIELMNP